MAKVRIEYQVLVSGIYPFSGEVFKKNGFVLKEIELNETLVTKCQKEGLIYMNPFVYNCSYTRNTDSRICYLVFNKNEYLELNVEDNKSVIEEIKKIDLIENVRQMEKELTLTINNCIKFPVIMIYVYDLEDKLITILGDIIKINIPSLLAYDKDAQFEKITRQNNRISNFTSQESINKLVEKNLLFKRALSFYYESFSVCDEKNGFILLTSSLETLLNKDTYEKIFSCEKCGQNVYKISDTVSTNVSKILFDDNLKSEFKKLYGKRSKYLHGKKVEITKFDEQYMQEIVRKVLLMYWFVSVNKCINNHKKIMAEILSNEYKNSIIYKPYFMALNNSNFSTTRVDILKYISEIILNSNNIQ